MIYRDLTWYPLKGFWSIHTKGSKNPQTIVGWIMIVSTMVAWGMEPTTSLLKTMSPNHLAKACGAFHSNNNIWISYHHVPQVCVKKEKDKKKTIEKIMFIPLIARLPSVKYSQIPQKTCTCNELHWLCLANLVRRSSWTSFSLNFHMHISFYKFLFEFCILVLYLVLNFISHYQREFCNIIKWNLGRLCNDLDVINSIQYLVYISYWTRRLT